MESSAKIVQEKRKRLAQPRQALEGQLMKSFFDFNSWTELEKRSRLFRSDKRKAESAEGVVCLLKDYDLRLELLGGKARQATRGARRWSWTVI